MWGLERSWGPTAGLGRIRVRPAPTHPSLPRSLRTVRSYELVLNGINPSSVTHTRPLWLMIRGATLPSTSWVAPSSAFECWSHMRSILTIMESLMGKGLHDHSLRGVRFTSSSRCLFLYHFWVRKADDLSSTEDMLVGKIGPPWLWYLKDAAYRPISYYFCGVPPRPDFEGFLFPTFFSLCFIYQLLEIWNVGKRSFLSPRHNRKILDSTSLQEEAAT